MKQITLILLLAFQLLPLAAQKMIDMNKKLLYLCTMLWAAILLNGCVKDELHNTPHPDRGAVKITTNWSRLSEDAVRPESYLLRIGETTHTVSGADNTFKHLLDEGTYTLLVHNLPNGITVGTTTATVNTLADGTLQPMPQYLFSAMQELNVQKDDTLRASVTMVQAGRRLNLVLMLKAGDAERIASSKATITGIAHTVDLRTGNPTAAQTGGTVAPVFVKTTVTRAAGINALATTLQLAGVVAGERQLLRIVVALTNGATVTVESDLTEALKNFGSSNLPITLNAEIPLPDDEVEGSFSGTITDWTEIDNGDIAIR